MLQGLDVCGPAPIIDVGSVGAVVDHMRIGTESIEDGLGDTGCRSVGAVDGDFAAAERPGLSCNQIAHIAVSARGEVNRAADPGPCGQGQFSHLTVQVGLDLLYHIVRQLLSRPVDDLDSIVIVGIVRG